MAAYILELSEKNRYVHISRGFIVISEGPTELGRVPVDDVLAVILSGEDVTVSKRFLAHVAEMNIPVVICGVNYAPVSIASPLSSHYRQLENVQNQTSASPVLKKQIWKSIVQAKIANQLAVLQTLRPQSADVQYKLDVLRQKVRSGDTDNNEAQAARLYWPALFGKGFIRDTESVSGRNVFLNYGYAVIRAGIIRAICAAGLLPLFGIHHKNKLNAFCLADDLMEPLRPTVDSLVVRKCTATTQLSPEVKRKLSTVLKAEVRNGEQKVQFVAMTHLMAQSLANSFAANQNLLQLPAYIYPA